MEYKFDKSLYKKLSVHEINSPIVTGGKTVFIKKMFTSNISNRWRDELNVNVGDEFRSLKIVEYRKCVSSGLKFFCPESAAGDKFLYSQLQKKSWYYMDDKWEFNVAINELRSNFKVLEIGSATGAFLSKLVGQGCEAVGVELNVNAAKCALSQGLNVEVADLKSISKKYINYFDAVCLFQVLEHISNPKDFFESLFPLLKPGAKILLSVPDDRFMEKVDPKKNGLLNSPPHHMTHWGIEVFKSLEQYYPVCLKSYLREPLAKYHVEWYLISLLRNKFYFLHPSILQLLFNKFTLSFFIFLLKSGMRKKNDGHTLFVNLEYSP